MHLVVPRVAYICPLDEPRVERHPHACWDVARSYIMMALSGKIPCSEVLLGILKDVTTFVLNVGISMKLEKCILQVIPITPQDAAAYPVHYASPVGEARATPLLWAGAKNPAGWSLHRVLGGGDGGPLRARWLIGRHQLLGLAVGRGTASPAP